MVAEGAAADWKWVAMRESSSVIRRWDDIISSNGSLPPAAAKKGHPKDPKGPKAGDRPNANGREKKSSLLKKG